MLKLVSPKDDTRKEFELSLDEIAREGHVGCWSKP